MENNSNNNNNNATTTTTTRITRQTTMMSMTAGVAPNEPLVPGALLQPMPQQPLALDQQRGHRQPAPIRRPRLLPDRPSQLEQLRLQLQHQPPSPQQQQQQPHQQSSVLLSPQQQQPQQPPPQLPPQLPPTHDQPFPLLNGFSDILEIIEVDD